MKKKKQLRAQLRKIVRSTPFQNQDKVKTIELIVLRAIELIQSYQRRAWVVSSQMMQNPSLRKARGRPNQTTNRTLLSGLYFEPGRWVMAKSRLSINVFLAQFQAHLLSLQPKSTTCCISKIPLIIWMSTAVWAIV